MLNGSCRASSCASWAFDTAEANIINTSSSLWFRGHQQHVNWGPICFSLTHGNTQYTSAAAFWSGNYIRRCGRAQRIVTVLSALLTFCCLTRMVATSAVTTETIVEMSSLNRSEKRLLRGTFCLSSWDTCWAMLFTFVGNHSQIKCQTTQRASNNSTDTNAQKLKATTMDMHEIWWIVNYLESCRWSG